jgi:hypothetical protein
VDAWSARPSMSSTLSPYMGKRSSRAWLFGRALHRALTPSLYSRLALVSSSTRRWPPWLTRASSCSHLHWPLLSTNEAATTSSSSAQTLEPFSIAEGCLRFAVNVVVLRFPPVRVDRAPPSTNRWTESTSTFAFVDRTYPPPHLAISTAGKPSPKSRVLPSLSLCVCVFWGRR